MNERAIMLMKSYVERHQVEFMLEQLSVKMVINRDPYTPFFILISMRIL